MSYMGECISCGERGTGSKVQSYIVCYRCQLKQSQSDLARLRARVGELEAALAPFARFASSCGPEMRDTALYLGGYEPDYGDTLDSRVTGAHFKAAIAALSPDAPGERGGGEGAL